MLDNLGKGGEGTINDFYDSLKNILSPPSLTEFAKKLTEVGQAASDINLTFLQSRQRIVELTQAVTNAAPNVVRLGGNLSDVSNTISEVALASNRNVVATTEQVEKLFAANKLLDKGAQTLTNSFLDVGMGVKDIGKNLEESIRYVQSIGGNSKEVVNTMLNYMDQLNRFQFEGGVKGLTKMAAQAAMLRFDMNQTFILAEKVLSPEGAIEVASAFQRLGVAAGNLVDPFQLMNQSINDPSGLQTSLADVAKQFTYFDEKTKTFKISPQGVLTLKEIGDQTGISSRELTKMGLAAAEMDKRLSAIKSAGLTIASEEDKQYLANIATLTDKGTYEVTLKDGTKKELQQLNQEEFDELIRQQKEGPKTLEEMTRKQMTLTETIMSDLRAVRETVVGGIVSAAPITNTTEGLRNVFQVLGGEISKTTANPEYVRKQVTDALYGIEGLAKDFNDPTKNKMDVLKNALEKVGDKFKEIGVDLDKGLEKILKNTEEKLTGANIPENITRELLGKYSLTEQKQTAAPTTVATKEKTRRLKEAASTTRGGETTSSSKVEVGGGFKLDVNFVGTEKLSQGQLQQIEKILYEWVRSNGTQDLIVKVSQEQNPTKAPK